MSSGGGRKGDRRGGRRGRGEGCSKRSFSYATTASTHLRSPLGGEGRVEGGREGGGGKPHRSYLLRFSLLEVSLLYSSSAAAAAVILFNSSEVLSSLLFPAYPRTEIEGRVTQSRLPQEKWCREKRSQRVRCIFSSAHLLGAMLPCSSGKNMHPIEKRVRGSKLFVMQNGRELGIAQKFVRRRHFGRLVQKRNSFLLLDL